MPKKSRDWKVGLIESLKDPEFAAGFIGELVNQHSLPYGEYQRLVRLGILTVYKHSLDREGRSLSECPGCGGPADNGHDREDPPNVYYCSKCESK